MSNEAFTVFCRNLAENVSETILYELFLQAGPVEDVRIPKRDGKNRNFGFVVYKHKASVKYAIELFRDTKLYGKTIALQNRILDAERAAKMNAMSWRNDEINCLRGGGPPPNFSRFNDMNALRGGMSSSYSRHDDSSYLRAGPSRISKKDDMMPRGHDNNSHKRFDSKSVRDGSVDPRFMNLYSNPYMSYDNDSRGSSSMRYDDKSSLRAGPSGISKKDNMMPRGHGNNFSNRFSSKYERDNATDPRFMNPYSNPYMDYSDADTRGDSSNHDRHKKGRYSRDNYDRHNEERFRKDEDDSSNRWGKKDKDDFSRRNTYKEDSKNDLRGKLKRSKSPDKSPLSKSYRKRTR